MRRIALYAGMLAAALSGCAKSAQITSRPPPDPLLRTRRPAPREMTRARPPRRVLPPRTRPKPAGPLDEWKLIPRAGIKPGLWRVIVVHHSASREATPQSMDNYHRNVRGWCNGLGYHFVIGNGVNTIDGRIYTSSRWRQQVSGAHCRSKSGRYFGAWRPHNYFNDHGIGICLIGNFENERPTPRQLAALEQLIGFLCSQSGIDPAHVYGHGEVTHKTACPGRHLTRELAQIRSAGARTLAVELAPGNSR